MAEQPVVEYRVSPSQVDTLVLDASLKEDHSGDVKVTEHPVESGSSVADHARVEPETLTLEGMVSATPLARAVARAVQAARPGTDSVLNAVRANAPDGTFGDTEYALAKLLDLKKAKQLVTVITSIRAYQNMLVTQLRFPRDPQSGEALYFTIAFREVQLVGVRRREVVVAKEPKANGKQAAGKQVAKPKDYESYLSEKADEFGGEAVKRLRGK